MSSSPPPLLPLEHIELGNLPGEALELIEAAPEGVLLLAEDEETVAVHHGVQDGGELLGEPQRALGIDLHLGVHRVLIQPSQDHAGVVPPAQPTVILIICHIRFLLILSSQKSNPFIPTYFLRISAGL